jgi:hypothetical protein
MPPPRAAACSLPTALPPATGGSARRPGLPGRSGSSAAAAARTNRRPRSATDLPLTTPTSAASPASRPTRPSIEPSTARQPQGLHPSCGHGRPATSTWSPTPPPKHGRIRTRPDGRGQTPDGWTLDGGQQTAERWTLWTTTPGDRTPDGWTAGSRTPNPDGWTPHADTGDRRRGLPAGRVDHATTPDRSIAAGRSAGQTSSGRATTRIAQQQGLRGHPRC